MPQPLNSRTPAKPRPAPRSVARRQDGWDDLVDSYLDDCKRRNHTAATRGVYGWVLKGKRMEAFRADQGIDTVPHFDSQMLRLFELELREAGMAVSTVHQYHRTIKTFLAWCRADGINVDERVAGVAGPRLPTIEPEIYTEEEIRALYKVTRTPRDRLLVEFLLRTGLRLSEAVDSEVDDVIDLGNRGAYIKVRQGKGRKDRHVPIDADLHKKIHTYIDKQRPTGCDALFPIARAGNVRKFSKEGMKSVLDRLGVDAGVHCHAHKFRHTFASRAIAEGVDALTLQKVLGHTTLTMVARYVHFGAGDLVDKWRARPGRSR